MILKSMLNKNLKQQNLLYKNLKKINNYILYHINRIYKIVQIINIRDLNLLFRKRIPPNYKKLRDLTLNVVVEKVLKIQNKMETNKKLLFKKISIFPNIYL